MELNQLFSLSLANEAASRKLGQDLALMARKGDLFALIGDLGAGKTSLARAFIRHFTDQPDLEVPSPTFNIVLEYKEAGQRAPLYHYDLYRLSDPDELQELGFDEALSEGIALVEWPENAGDSLGNNFLAIQIDFDESGTGRVANFYGSPEWKRRWQRHQTIEEFLNKTLIGGFTRHHMMGDASLRHYEQIEPQDKDGQLILMNDKGRNPGAIIKDGKSYPEIAHITLDIAPFIGICNLLREHGFAAPKILDFDLDEGLILLEHLGNGSIVTKDKKPIAERYQVAAEFLAQLHQVQFPNSAPVTNEINHPIPRFDEDAMMIEVELFLTWYLPRFSKREISREDQQEFYQIWQSLIDKAQGYERNLLLRDYHSPNIIWRDGESEFNRIGLIDFQDAMIGPTSYDVISLTNDARTDISPELEQKLMAAYMDARSRHDIKFNRDEFATSYAIMAAHRATKILGGFVRSDERDGKPTYLAYLPRMRDYLNRALKNPALSDFKSWMSKHGLL